MIAEVMMIRQVADVIKYKKTGHYRTCLVRVHVRGILNYRSL